MSESIEVSDNPNLSALNPADPKLFSEEKILPYFKQMRAVQPKKSKTNLTSLWAVSVTTKSL